MTPPLNNFPRSNKSNIDQFSQVNKLISWSRGLLGEFYRIYLCIFNLPDYIIKRFSSFTSYCHLQYSRFGVWLWFGVKLWNVWLELIAPKFNGLQLFQIWEQKLKINWTLIKSFEIQSFFLHYNFSLTSPNFGYRLYKQESENQIRTFI